MITYAGLARLLEVAHHALAAKRPAVWVVSAMLNEVKHLADAEAKQPIMQPAYGVNGRAIWQHGCGSVEYGAAPDVPPEYCGMCQTGGEWARLYVDRTDGTRSAGRAA